MIKITDDALRKLVAVNDDLLTEMFKEKTAVIEFEVYGIRIYWEDKEGPSRNSIHIYTDSETAGKKKENDKFDNQVTWIENVRFCRTL